jgi:hypothetical protein
MATGSASNGIQRPEPTVCTNVMGWRQFRHTPALRERDHVSMSR